MHAARFDDHSPSWQISTDRGGELTASICVMATGCLSQPQLPEVTGLPEFKGGVHHTARWPHEGVDFTGQRVAVFGTGSSGIQVIPQIAELVTHLTVFQRTPNFSVPMGNRPWSPADRAAARKTRRSRREQARHSVFGVVTGIGDPEPALAVDPAEREARYRAAWQAGNLFALPTTFNDLLIDREANETAAAFCRARIRELVDNPATAELLTPTDYPFGTKRLCVDNGHYYATFNLPHVDLVDLRTTPLTRITRGGVVTTRMEHPVDSIVFATGFDAITGTLFAIDIRGRDGQSLTEKWAAGPVTYLGLATAGFPNLFIMTGPGSPSAFSNMIISIEQHADWITDAIRYTAERGATTFEATEAAERSWTEHVQDVVAATLLPEGPSWYAGANTPGKVRVFMPYIGGVNTYREICDSVAANNYEGFTVT